MKNEAAASGLSVVVQHYDRPWCLEITVAALHRQLTREGIPHQIILADDGSKPELRALFDRLPLDAVVCPPRHHQDGEQSSVYETLRLAYERVSLPFVLFVQDDFWLVPQGFIDQGKCHLPGLRMTPDCSTAARPLRAAVRLLQHHPEARLIELARSFANDRYHCLPESECLYEDLRFRAKSHTLNPRFYSCDWPHLMRTTDERAVPLPCGSTIWAGERLLGERRRQAFGPGDWVYNPERSFFAHVNVFTWRAVQKRCSTDRALRWEGAGQDADLPFGQAVDMGWNARLLEAYCSGQVRGSTQLYARLGPLAYLDDLYRQMNP